ncbi:MAG: HAD-IB family hydrolase [Acidimicrobiales bacterium]
MGTGQLQTGSVGAGDPGSRAAAAAPGAEGAAAAGISVAGSLSGRRVAVTGATGFLGTALVERLLRCVPGSEVALLVRPGKRSSAASRVRREVLRNDCFDRLRAQLGDGFDGEMSRRVHVLAGDVTSELCGLTPDDLDSLALCDVVVHSAATVSFDAPLDSAVQVNLLGPSRVAGAIRAAAERSGRAPAHLVSVSTAYVAGSRKGPAVEALLSEVELSPVADWSKEAAAAERARLDADAQSRSPAMLARLAREARQELGGAGLALLAERAERLRLQFVHDSMVEAGRARARGLGWPDAYAYTKALGEQALVDGKGHVPVSIVRPSIIESSLSEPRPGWIRGFRMAEPVILSYGRGLLKRFPGSPEGVVDVIPVDFVVSAILAVAAKGPGPVTQVYQVASGTRNPLRYSRLVDLVRSWFLDHPLYDSHGQPIVAPEWSFPERGKVEKELRRMARGFAVASKVAGAVPPVGPLRRRAAASSITLHSNHEDAERALGYVQLYGAYAESEASFSIDASLELWSSLDDASKEAFDFDPATIEWGSYVHDIHLPSIVAHSRARTSPSGRPGPSRSSRALSAILSSSCSAAVFDLENTLIASNVVESYTWLATRHTGGSRAARLVAELAASGPRLWAMDHRDRGDFLRHFYRRYKGAPAAELQAEATRLFSYLLASKAYPAGLRRVREHRALGHKTLLVTGALDFVVAPLAPLFDTMIAASLGISDGLLTGEMTAAPPTAEARVSAIQDWAREVGVTLSSTAAYADSSSDLPMLEAVGFPVAVNPEPKLANLARRRGWHVEQWDRQAGFGAGGWLAGLAANGGAQSVPAAGAGARAESPIWP